MTVYFSRSAFFLQALILVFTAWGSLAAASDRSAQVVDRIEMAYGGHELANLTSVQIITDRKVAWPGQGQSARLTEFMDDRMIKALDLDNGWGSVERWTNQNGNFYHNLYLLNAHGVFTADFGFGTIQSGGSETFIDNFLGDIRSSDLLLAWWLTQKDTQIDANAETFYLGRRHDRFTVSLAPETPELTVFVDRQTGLITRVDMSRAFGDVSLLFSDHANTGVHKAARRLEIYMDGRLTEIDPNLRVETNQSIAHLLQVPEGLEAPADTVDLSEMTVEQIAPDLFMVGREDYSIFASTPEGVIGINPYAGLGDRFEALQQHLGYEAPLVSVIATHHHDDHLAAISEAVELGAVIHAPAETISVLSRDYNLADDEMQRFEDESLIGPFQAHITGTSHAVENAFIVHQASGVLFQEDHYHPLLEDHASRVQPTSVQMYDFLVARNVPISHLVSGHARKVEDWSLFSEAVNQRRPIDICPGQRAICHTAPKYR